MKLTKSPIIFVFALILMTFRLVYANDEICSYARRREMLREHCGRIRRRRGFSSSDYENVKHHQKSIVFLANDTTGGILIRDKRGRLEYCCTYSGKCDKLFTC